MSPSVKALGLALNDSVIAVRRAAAIALGNLGDSSATAALLPCLADPDDGFVIAVIMSLGQLGDNAAVPKLLQFLAEPPIRLSGSGGCNFPFAASCSLAAIGTPPAVAAALAYAARQEQFSNPRHKVLERLRPSAIPGLIEALRSHDALVRQLAAEVLGTVGTKQ